MIYNYINGEVTNEKSFITDSELIMLQDGWYNGEVIPSIRIPEYGTIWYLQQGMTLFLVKKTHRHFQPLTNYIAIEQEIKKNEMAIKEIHSAIQIPDDDKQLLIYYNTEKEKESIKMNVQDILSKLKFIHENEIEYMCNKIDEFFTNPAEKTEPIEKVHKKRNWGGQPKEITFNGKTYQSITELIQDLSISRGTYYEHLKNGMTQEEAIKKCLEPARGKYTKRYTYLGEEMRLVDLSRLSGIPLDTLAARLKNGWSVADAVETPVRPKNG